MTAQSALVDSAGKDCVVDALVLAVMRGNSSATAIREALLEQMRVGHVSARHAPRDAADDIDHDEASWQSQL